MPDNTGHSKTCVITILLKESCPQLVVELLQAGQLGTLQVESDTHADTVNTVTTQLGVEDTRM